MKRLTLLLIIPALALFSCNHVSKAPAYHIPDYSYNAGIEDTTTVGNDTAVQNSSLAQTSLKARDGLIQVYIHTHNSPKEKIAESSVSSGIRRSILQDISAIFRMLSKTGNKE